jgi:hypothetical protein
MYITTHNDLQDGNCSVCWNFRQPPVFDAAYTWNPKCYNERKQRNPRSRNSRGHNHDYALSSTTCFDSRQGHESLFVVAHHTDCGPSSCLSSEDWGLIILCLAQERSWCKQRCKIRLHTTCSRRPLTAEAQVQVGSVVVKLPLGHVIQFFGFPQSVSFHRGSPHLHIKQSLLMAVVLRHSLIPSDIITF